MSGPWKGCPGPGGTVGRPCQNGKELSAPLTTHPDERRSTLRTFDSLSEKELLALAIALEEEDARIYYDMAEGLEAQNSAEAEQFHELRAEEDGHRHRLLDLYRQKFGEHIPLIRRQDVKGFV